MGGYFDLQVRQDGTTAKFVLFGEFDVDAGGAFVAAAESAFRSTSRVIVELGGIEFIDSDGLRALVEVKRLACEAGIELHVAHVTSEVRQLFRDTHLDGYFGTIEPDVTQN